AVAADSELEMQELEALEAPGWVPATALPVPHEPPAARAGA
ncbi:daptide-type RiPP, partial [Streptomyces sp. NPDC006385]